MAKLCTRTEAGPGFADPDRVRQEAERRREEEDRWAPVTLLPPEAFSNALGGRPAEPTRSRPAALTHECSGTPLPRARSLPSVRQYRRSGQVDPSCDRTKRQEECVDPCVPSS